MRGRLYFASLVAASLLAGGCASKAESGGKLAGGSAALPHGKSWIEANLTGAGGLGVG